MGTLIYTRPPEIPRFRALVSIAAQMQSGRIATTAVEPFCFAKVVREDCPCLDGRGLEARRQVEILADLRLALTGLVLKWERGSEHRYHNAGLMMGMQGVYMGVCNCKDPLPDSLQTTASNKYL